MNFLPKVIENLIMDYKTQMEDKHAKEKKQLRKINEIREKCISVRKDIYIPIIKLYNTFNSDYINYKKYSRKDSNYIVEEILNEYKILFKWKNPAKRHRQINGLN